MSFVAPKFEVLCILLMVNICTLSIKEYYIEDVTNETTLEV